MKMFKFFWIIFTACLIASDAEAFKRGFEYSRLIGNPIIGKTIAVGKLIEENGKQYFIGERGWTNVPKRFYVEKEHDPYQVGVYNRGVTGEKYVLSSLGETTDVGILEPKYFVLLSFNSQKDKDDIKKIVEKLSSKNIFSDKINPSWQFCESDKECIQIKNQCGNKIGVNSKYRKNYEDFLKTIKEKADCTKDIKIEKVSKCVEYFCS